MIENAKEKDRAATKKIDDLEMELEQIKESMQERENNNVQRRNDNESGEKKCKLTCKDNDIGLKFYSGELC